MMHLKLSSNRIYEFSILEIELLKTHSLPLMAGRATGVFLNYIWKSTLLFRY